MVRQPHPDDLAQLRDEFVARFAAQDAEIARLKRRRRIPRRFLPFALVGVLVALLPLALLAAGPTFSDLGTAALEHQGDIQAIGDAGITTGFPDPNDSNARLYDPKANVTREEMASFLSRTAGIGGNPPVANAKTAESAPNGWGLIQDGVIVPANGTATREVWCGLHPPTGTGFANLAPGIALRDSYPYTFSGIYAWRFVLQNTTATEQIISLYVMCITP
jgi:hypothetical protein